ncbi:hypothetical protein [Sediminibacterium soli]|uniref:hypothetical protein n=1 Tax=Sediminibacterium soli TaxID=2698829 RepID=UPI00137A6AC5|nr:hypothetical protein [Sediminibacterium soli]NCI45816.1 hypothetical protein [Sediminibacterium soli]
MIDSQFDDFAKGRLGDHEVPVPDNLWDRITDGRFDQFIGDKLKDANAPVSPGLWDKITDAQFDGFVGSTLAGAEATVPGGLWEKVREGQFDGFVRDSLANATAPVPPGLWEKIMPEEDDDKGGLIWFRNAARIAAIFLLIAGLAAGSYYWYKTTQKDNPAGGTGNDSTANQPAAAGVLGNTPKQENTNGTIPDNNTVGITGDNHPAAANPAANTGRITDNNPTHAGTRNRRNNAAFTETGINGSVTNNKGLTAIPQPGRPATDPRGMAGGLTDNPDRTAATSSDNGLPLGFPEPYQALQWSKAATISPSVNRQLADLHDKKLSIGNHASLFKSIIICPTGRTGNTDWYLEAYGSPDIALRSFSNNSATRQYVSRKDSSESMRPGFSAGIRIVKPINDNILVKAGLQYSQINQKYVYRTENEIKNITVVTTRTIIRSPGDTVVVRDTSSMQQIGFKNNTVINRFRTLDLPVTVGYQFGNDDLRIGVNAGVILNLSSWYQGVMLDSSLATVPIQKNSNTVYKSNIGLGLYGSVSLVKKLSDDLHVFAEPYFRYNLSNMTTPGAAYNQKFSIGGISLGIRLNLNRQ